MTDFLPEFYEAKKCEQHYAQSSDTEFHPNLTINAESTDRNSFTLPPPS